MNILLGLVLCVVLLLMNCYRCLLRKFCCFKRAFVLLLATNATKQNEGSELTVMVKDKFTILDD